MRFVQKIWLRVFVGAAFLLATIGVPLYMHVCSMTGAHPPLTSCGMRHETAAETCCAGGQSEEAPFTNSITQNGPRSGACCFDVDMTPRVKDDFISQANSDNASFHIVAVIADAVCVLPYTARPAAISNPLACDSSPPSIGDKYILGSSLLI